MKKNKVLIVIGIAVLVTGATFAVYYYRKNKTKPVADTQTKYPSLVTTKVGTQIKSGIDASADVLKYYDQAGIELMVTDTKVIAGTTWYNVLDYSSMAEGWVRSILVDFKI